MQFLYDEKSGNETIELKNENFKYIVKVRRHKENDEILLRHPVNSNDVHIYILQKINPKHATLILKETKHLTIKAKKSLHLAWCVIDSNSIEKALPMLNEIGVDKITFIYCERSQKNIKLNLERFERLLKTSSMQCGRSQKMKLEISKSLNDFLNENPNTSVIDFSSTTLSSENNYDTLLIGCEGGFSENEHEEFKKLNLKIIGLDSKMILRSESATVAVASKILL